VSKHHTVHTTISVQKWKRKFYTRHSLLLTSYSLPTMPKALFIIAKQGFRDEELFDTKQILDTAGIETVVASTEAGEAQGSKGGIAKIDIEVKDARIEDYDILILIGGPGATGLADYSEVIDIVKKANELQKKIAAICISPYVLARAGVLTGKKATTFPGEPALSEFTKQGVIHIEDSVVQDGRFITANGPSSAKDFGQKIVENL